MLLAPVYSQSIFLPGNCSTDVAGVGDSGDVVCFYVGHYACHRSLLVKFFTDPGSTIGCTCMVFTKHNHELELVIQILQVSSHSVVSDSYNSF